MASSTSRVTKNRHGLGQLFVSQWQWGSGSQIDIRPQYSKPYIGIIINYPFWSSSDRFERAYTNSQYKQFQKLPYKRQQNIILLPTIVHCDLFKVRHDSVYMNHNIL